MKWRQGQVFAWLKAKRGQERSVRSSVATWVEMDKRRTGETRSQNRALASADRDRILNIRKPRSTKSYAHLKKTVFFTEDEWTEIKSQSERLGWSASKVLQTSWAISRPLLKKFGAPA